MKAASIKPCVRPLRPACCFKAGVLKSIIPLRLRWLQDIELTVGKRIGALRAKKGWSQDEFAHRAGLNRTHLYRLERGLQSMTLATLKTVADTLEVRVVELPKGF